MIFKPLKYGEKLGNYHMTKRQQIQGQKVKHLFDKHRNVVYGTATKTLRRHFL